MSRRKESTPKEKPAKKSMLERAQESLNSLKPGEWQQHCRKSDEEEDRLMAKLHPSLRGNSQKAK